MHSAYSNSEIDRLQRGLSAAQAIPIFGQFVVSEAKIIISQAQIIMGVAYYTFGQALVKFVQDSEKNREYIVYGKHHILQGAISWIYAKADQGPAAIICVIIEVIRLPKTIPMIYAAQEEQPLFVKDYVAPFIALINPYTTQLEAYVNAEINRLVECATQFNKPADKQA